MISALLIGGAAAFSPLHQPRSAVQQRANVVAAERIGEVPAAALAKKYDMIVVGGGPAGVAGALKGAYLGKVSRLCPDIDWERRLRS